MLFDILLLILCFYLALNAGCCFCTDTQGGCELFSQQENNSFVSMSYLMYREFSIGIWVRLLKRRKVKWVDKFLIISAWERTPEYQQPSCAKVWMWVSDIKLWSRLGWTVAHSQYTRCPYCLALTLHLACSQAGSSDSFWELRVFRGRFKTETYNKLPIMPYMHRQDDGER